MLRNCGYMAGGLNFINTFSFYWLWIVYGLIFVLFGEWFGFIGDFDIEDVEIGVLCWSGENICDLFEDSGVECKGLCIDGLESDKFMRININWTYIIVIHVINIISVTLFIFIKLDKL